MSASLFKCNQAFVTLINVYVFLKYQLLALQGEAIGSAGASSLDSSPVTLIEHANLGLSEQFGASRLMQELEAFGGIGKPIFILQSNPRLSKSGTKGRIFLSFYYITGQFLLECTKLMGKRRKHCKTFIDYRSEIFSLSRTACDCFDIHAVNISKTSSKSTCRLQ